MTVVRYGDSVQLHYTTYAADGCVIETSVQRDPLEFTVGSPEIIAGINRAVVGMRHGERRRIAVSPEHAFGFRDSRLQQVTPRLGFLERADDGDQLAACLEGIELDLWVRAITESEITLDANHPLAGESLVYEIEVVAVAPSMAG
jgi:FKBP-type peptidyl-prolyl cis-trans isomerase 2